MPNPCCRVRTVYQRMRILILTQWFDPEPTFKGLLFARELAARGHEVEVLTGFPNYPDGKVYPGYRIRPWVREKIDGINVLRVALYPSHNKSGLNEFQLPQFCIFGSRHRLSFDPKAGRDVCLPSADYRWFCRNSNWIPAQDAFHLRYLRPLA